MSFSSILDISSFFIGVLVNLLLMAMICFYFKRKIDNLELSQSEQAKMLFQMVQGQQNTPPMNETNENTFPILNNLDLSQLEHEENKQDEPEESDDEGDSDSDSESEEEEDDSEVVVETKTIEYEEPKPIEVSVEETNDYSKMTVKELRSVLEQKGVQLNSRSIKKQELIHLVSTTVDEVEEVKEVDVVKKEESMIVHEPEPEPEPVSTPAPAEEVLSIEPEIIDIN